MELQIKELLMSTVEMRTEVTGWLEELDDNLLAAVHTLVGAYVKKKVDPIIGYEINGQPITTSGFLKEAEESLAAVDQGEYTTIDELDKESETWLNLTK